MDWLDLLAVQGTLKSLLQHHSTKASILQCSTFFIVQLSYPYMTTGKTIALTRQNFVGKLSLLFNMLSRVVIAFLPRSKHLLISWLQSPSAVTKIKSVTVSSGTKLACICILDLTSRTMKKWISVVYVTLSMVFVMVAQEDRHPSSLFCHDTCF